MALAKLISAEASAASSAKDKTKSKQRYLKRKKERRKQRKSVPGKSAGRKEDDGSGESGDDEGAEEAEDEVMEELQEKKKKKKAKGDVRGESEEPMKKKKKAKGEVQSEEEEPVKKKKKSKAEDMQERPKKRRKLSPELEDDEVRMDEDAEPAEDGDPDPEQAAENIDASPPKRTGSPTLSGALPSFPRPSIPNAPSKLDLALQGLDGALLDAEIVDPAITLAIPDEQESDSEVVLSDKTRRRLKELGIVELFAVQTALLPFLLPQDRTQHALYLPYQPPRDACVSAPTGSGKTLAYVVPIVEILSSRIVTRLRALVVLPTRDLVIQVRETFEAIAKGRGLKIASATGQHSFTHEQAQIVGDKSPELLGGSSKVDILVCTPGRLIDHLNGTPNFSLQHLRFLVIDEADRLLAQSFQDWLARVLAATRPAPQSTLASSLETLSLSKQSHVPYPDALAPAFAGALGFPRTELDERREVSCQKLLFSATLTRDPGKIAALELREPKYFVVQSAAKGQEGARGVLDVVMERFSMPATLSEHMVVCDAARKPLMLLHLVHAKGVKNALVFTKSADSTARLVKLVQFFEEARTKGAGSTDRKAVVIKAYSSDLSAGERKTILESFRAQEIDILVCSDLISRGIDISHVSHVLSYDAPVDMRKYVHRVGRTARAGRAGDAWTLVEEQEARYFKEMMKAADHLEEVKRLRVGEKDVEGLVEFYEVALGRLKEAYGRGGSG